MVDTPFLILYNRNEWRYIMAVKLRLTRMGAKRRPMYRIVASDARRSRDGQYLELIGTYNPTTDPATFKIDDEKALKWLSTGAIPSDTVKSLFQAQGIMKKFAESKVKPVKKEKKETKVAKKEEVKKEAAPAKVEKKPAAKKETKAVAKKTAKKESK